MKIIIDNSSSTPIYEQIKNQIREQIIEGSLSGGEQLPSIRALAKDLGISIMTVKKSYDELEAAGFMESVQGKGSYVLEKNPGLEKEVKQREVEDYIQKIVDISQRYGISKNEIYEVFEYMFDE